MLKTVKKQGLIAVLAGGTSWGIWLSQVLPLKGAEVDPPRIPRCELFQGDGKVKCAYNDPEEKKPSDYFEGYLVNGRPEGFGVYVYSAEGDRYEGEFRNGLPNGQGFYLFKDDSRWIGEFRDGLIVRGTVVRPNGDSYTGGFTVIYNLSTKKFTSLPKDLNGRLAFANGDRFLGSFFGGQPFGRGVFSRPDGSRCNGYFFNNELDARGFCRYANGTRYDGEFRKAIPHGEGTLIDVKGRRFKGVFRNGKLLQLI